MAPMVSDIFDVAYGQSLSLNHLEQTTPGRGVAFVSRTAKNNGVSAWVEPLQSVSPLPAGLLTVCLRSRNHALATFVQPREFYCGYHIYVLTPKSPMAIEEKLWWAGCIEANRFRYNFGRQANRTLSSLQLPEKPPLWVSQHSIQRYASSKGMAAPNLDTNEWGSYRLQDLFDLVRGRNVLKRDMAAGDVAYVSASATNNGISAWIDLAPDFPGGQITVSSNGSVGEAFYQPRPFIASGDVTVLVPLRPISEGAALFVSTLLFAEKFRWNYGRKWATNRMRDSVIRLPALPNGEPDWEAAERYMLAQPLGATVLASGASHSK